MNNILEIEKKCCGCKICKQICPKNAIVFKKSEEGFCYPTVTSGCIQCGLCLNNCPVGTKNNYGDLVSAYALALKDRNHIMNSSSGGAFYGLAKFILDQGGAVYGCAELDICDVKHIRIIKTEELPKLQGSKYVESDISEIYELIKNDINNRKIVLFSGTPCQVASIKKIIGDSDYLYTVDFVCHGVPNKDLYIKYISYIENKKKIKINKFYFRSKRKHGWSLTYRIEYTKNNKKRIEEHISTKSSYYDFFLKGYDYRESCYVCKYATFQRVSDITIGDFWGIESLNIDIKTFDLNDGISSVLVNSTKGKLLIESAIQQFNILEVKAEDIIKNNGQLNHPVIRPAERTTFYKDLNDYEYEYVEKKYQNRKELIIDSIKDCIPNRIRLKIKLLLKNVIKTRKIKNYDN